MSRAALVVIALSLAALLSACDRPRVVSVDVNGAENLTLRGKFEREGTLKRSIQNGERVVAKDVRVVVQETWLVRREKGEPPAYRIVGHYDPANAADGFTLPAGALDVYFLTSVLPDRAQPVVVPADELTLD